MYITNIIYDRSINTVVGCYDMIVFYFNERVYNSKYTCAYNNIILKKYQCNYGTNKI